MKIWLLVMASMIFAQELPEGVLTTEGALVHFNNSVLEVKTGEVRLTAPINLRLKTNHGEYYLEAALGRIRRSGFDLDAGRVYRILREGVLLPIDEGGFSFWEGFDRFHSPFKNTFMGTGGITQLEFVLE